MWKASPLGGLLLVGLLLAGCGAAAPSPGTTIGRARRPIEPRLDGTSPLSIERLGRRLKVGDDAAVAQDVFPKPPRAYVFNDLPDRLVGDFDARGWESRDEGFGAILYSGRIAMAMRQFYAIDSSRYDELLQTIQTANRRVKSRTLSGDNVEFTFWEFEPQVLMVLRRGVKQGAYDLTIALGDRTVMDELDMTPTKAQATIERLRSGTEGEAATKSPSARPKGATSETLDQNATSGVNRS